MVRKRMIRIAAWLLIGILCAGSIPMTTKAEEPLHILALGDSIALGYGLEDKEQEAYGAVLAKKAGAKFTNEGINGLRSEDLIERLEAGEYDEQIKDTDIILLSIGSNDVLKNCVIQAAGAVGIHTEYKQIYPELKARYLEHPAEMTEMLADLRKVKQELRENQEVLDICDQFEGKFEQILRMIKEKNPYVVIYADNVYNPYVAVNYTYGPIEVLNLSELTETYIRRINEAFHSSSKEYTVINAYSIFQKDGYTNVKAGTLENLEKFNLDPHPNREGHIQIAEKIYEKLDLTPPKAKAVREDAKIEITADEKVRFVEGKHLYLKSEEKSYSYELTGKEEFKEKKSGRFVCRIPIRKFTDGEELGYLKTYRIILDKDAMKDMGNNSCREQELGSFKTGFPVIWCTVAGIVIVGVLGIVIFRKRRS